jgi:hypothetical protein
MSFATIAKAEFGDFLLDASELERIEGMAGELMHPEYNSDSVRGRKRNVRRCVQRAIELDNGLGGRYHFVGFKE